MYPVPPRPETCTLTETIVGNWMESRGCRDKIILATKVFPSASFDCLRLARVHLCLLMWVGGLTCL